MKKIIFLFVMLAVSANIFSGADSKNNTSSQQNGTQSQPQNIKLLRQTAIRIAKSNKTKNIPKASIIRKLFEDTPSPK